MSDDGPSNPGAFIGSLVAMVILFLAVVYLAPAALTAGLDIVPSLIVLWFIVTVLRAIIRQFLE